MTQDTPDEPVGSLGEEAARLLDALSQWTGADAGSGHDAPGEPDEPDEPGAGPSSGAAFLDAAAHTLRGVAEALRRIDEHVATDDPACRFCPLCQVIHAVRETGPEVRGHLGDAATSLLAAAGSLLAERGGPPAADPTADADPATTDRVQHIDLSDGDEDAPGPDR